MSLSFGTRAKFVSSSFIFQCESGVAIRAMLDLINTPPHKIVFLGPGCSIATKPIAEAASYWQAVQVSVRNKSNKIISKKMKNKKQIKQTIKTMKQVSCRKKKTTTTTTTSKTIKTQQRGVRLFFSHFTGERASAGGSTQFFFCQW